MRTLAVFKGWFAVVLLTTSAAWLHAQGVVLGPTLGNAPDISEGELLVSELNCAACHSIAENDPLRLESRKSPILGKSGLRLTPQYLRRFLDDPASYKPGTTMPNLLHHLSGKDKADAVEALVHFLISEQDTTKNQEVGAEDFQVKQGRTLYHTVGCVACHEPQTIPNAVPGITPEDPKLERFDPSLTVPESVPLGDLTRKTTVDQLAKFLMDPLKVRPSGRMPSLNLTGTEAASLAVYLLRGQAAGLNDPSKRSLIAGVKYQYYEENFSAGMDFETLTPKGAGNVGSFDASPRKRDTSFGLRFTGSINIPTSGNYTFFTRSDDGSMLYIDGKLVVNNDGDHAPEEKRGNIELVAGEHGIMVTFYQNGAGFEFAVQWRGPGFRKQPIPSSVLSHFGQPMVAVDSEEFAFDRSKADKGRQLFASLGCAACHQVSEPIAGGVKARALKDLAASENGCLSEKPGPGVPKFGFNAQQRRALSDSINRKTLAAREINPQEQVTRTMARLNCYACHTRDGKGGPTNPRLAYFRVVGELDMGDEGRIPPHLTGVGAKLRPEWMHEVLVNRGRVRPYMATRMPQFGSENVGSMPGTFEKADARTDVRPEPEITPRDAKFGRKLAGVGGLVCISCHTVAHHKSLGIPAIDLTMMSKRLKYDWCHHYLLDPPSLRPGTRMPAFWPNGEAVNKEVLGGNTDAQINALWAYLSSHPESDLPPGLIQGRMELVAETEPIIYRNFIEGAGPRAIGVGYPEKVNLAFDADKIRLAMIWQGPFIDAAPHRIGRGEGYQPPLGNNIVKMPEGPEFAVLENGDAAWPSSGGKQGAFKMGGYSLDEKRRPTFFYSYKGMRVEETFEPIMGEVDAYFRRTMTLTGNPVDHLYFRAAVGQIEGKGNGFLLDGRVALKFPGESPILRAGANPKELLLPVKFSGDKAQIVEDIVW